MTQLTGINGRKSEKILIFPQTGHILKRMHQTKWLTFFVCPTVYWGLEYSYNMEVRNEDTKANFLGAVNMEKGLAKPLRLV